MNKTKRFLGLFLVVFMLLAFVPLQALASTTDEIAPVGSDAQATEVASATDETLPDGVTADSFGDNTVTDGANYYANLQTAVEAVCGTETDALYCKPNADVGSLQHAPVISSLTIYGNGASVTGGAERDFDIGNTDPSLGKDVTGDMTLKVVSLNGCGAWGAKATEHTVNLVFENCQNMGKVFLTGTTGTLNISITDCAFEGVIAEAVYSNANGEICLDGVAFSNLNKAVNLNHKAEGEQKITIKDCTFTNCGNDVSADQIPVRVLSSVEGGVSVLTVSGCTFSGTPEGGADILLDYGVGKTTATIDGTAANVIVELENNVGTETAIAADETKTFANVKTVAQIGDVKYATLAEALEVAKAGDEVVLLANVTSTETVYVPAGVIFNGNGFAVGGIIYANGDITFKGVTKALDLDTASNVTITIGEGACLELTGTARMSIGLGCTFNITGTIVDAKTANVADITPSLIMQGASFTGAGVTFNVTNAYIKNVSSYCSSSKSASGTFKFNINNSIWEQTAGKLAFEEQSTAATVNFYLTDSVLTTASHLIFGVSRGEVVIDNSNVNVGKSYQIENQSTLIVKNGSVVNGSVATSSNAKNPGTLIVDNATYAVTGEFSGSDLGTGTIIIKNGASFTAGSITKANIQIDATNMKAGDEINITANLANLAGTIEVINNNALEAEIVDGKIVLSQKSLAGSGTEEDPYLIASFDDLKLFRDLVNNGTYVNVYVVLTDNIDMEQEDWVSIGTSTHPFTGTFDGKGFTISNIWSYERGLFGYTSKGNYVDDGLNGRATIKNLTINGVEVYNQSVSAVGGLVGQTGQNTEISNVTVTGYISIYGYGYVGGLVGQGYAHIDNCQVIGVNNEDGDQSTISANYWAAAGIIGHAGSEGGASITNCSVKNVMIYSYYYGAGSIAGVGTTGPIENVSAENVVIEAGSDPDANGFLVGCNYDKITGNSTAKNITMTVGGAVVSAPQDMVAQIDGKMFASLQAAIDAAVEGDVIELLANVTTNGSTAQIPAGVTIKSNGYEIDGSIRMLGDLTLDGPLTITGGLWVGKDGETLTATLAGDKLSASYFMFQHGAYTINADIDATYGYLSYNGTFEVNSTIHTTGANGEVLYINGNVTLNGGAVLDSDNSVFVCNDNASLTIKSGAKVDSNVKITVAGAELYSAGDISGTINNSANGTIVISGGTYTMAIPEDWCADGYAAIKDLDGNYVVGVKPTADVNANGPTTIPGGEYSIYDGSFKGTQAGDPDMPLSFVMQFLADQTAEDMASSPYAKWYADFVITFTGIENGSFTADNCYLAGHYGEWGWVKVPVDGMLIENDVRYPVMLGVGLPISYKEVCTSVKDFMCALYLTPEILEANPNLQVKLELAVVENSDDVTESASALVNQTSGLTVNEHQYEAEDFVVNYVAQIGDNKFTSIQAAINAAQAGDVVTLIKSVEVTGTIVVDKNITLDLGGKTITNVGGNANHTFRVAANMTVKNGTIDNTEGGYCFIVGYNTPVAGNLTIESGSYYGNTSVVSVTYGSVVINGGYFEATPYNGSYDYTFNCVDRFYTAGNATIAVYGGTFYKFNPENNASEGANTNFCANGYAAIKDLDGNYVVGVKPTATVDNKGSMVIPGGEYSIYDGSFKVTQAGDPDMPLSFVMQFVADQTAADMENSPYADWYADFVITFTGIVNGSFTADGCYLAGFYGDFGWVMVPVDGMPIENDVRYPVMLGVGMGQKYDYVCSGVQDFKCALYLTPEILEANPNLEVNLELAIVDNSKGEDAACNALIDGETTYKVVDYNYDAEDFVVVAQVGNKTYATLQEAIDAAQDGETIKLLADVELDASITVTKSITIDGNDNKITQSANCDNTYALLYFDANDVLDITIKNVTFDGIKGGAAIRTYGANMTIDNCVFQNCEHTQVQGLVRLTQGKASITNTKFLNNNCSMAVSFNYDTAGLEGDTFVIDNCVFEGNTADTTAIVYYVKGDGCTITNSEFVGNTVNCNSNGAVIYLGFQEDCTVTNNLFKDNVVTDSSTSTRVAGAIFFGYAADISGNAFINNTATNANGDVLGQVCTSTYYNCTIDLSGNYWGGEAPVYGKDYTVQHQTGDATFALDNYFAAYSTDANGNVVMSGNATTFNYVAQVGKFKYESVTAAINAANDGDTVQLLAGTISEYIAPWAGDSTHKSEKSITIVGAENFGTILTGGLYLGYDDSGCRAHTITIKGIAFEGKGILVAGQQNVVIEGNKFTNITTYVATTHSANANAISIIGKNVNATIKDNVIDATASGGIHLRDVANATVTGNTVANTNDNAITINPTAGSNGEFVITDNVLSNWGLGGEGRAIRVSGGATVEINGNVMIHEAAPEQFVKVTGATSVNVNENYWSGKSPVDAGVIDVAAATPENYYADAELTQLITISYVAEVNGVKYESLQEAFAAVQNGETIKLLADVELDASIKITEGNVTFDLNGNKLTGPDVPATQSYYAFIVDGGSLTLKDSVGGGEIWAKCYGIETKSGSFTMESGIITATNNNTLGTAIANYGGTVTINGGTLSGTLGSVYTDGYFANADTTIYGGTFNGYVTVGDSNQSYSETVTSASNDYTLLPDYKWVEQDGVYVLTAKVYVAQVGDTKYESLQDAIDAANGETVVLIADIELNASIKVAGNVTLDLAGYTITGTDNNTSSNFYLFDVTAGASFTVEDSVGEGAITLTATNERNWNSSSVVIANNRGTVTVNGGTITHLGGTSMAYALDNLTNGNNTVATMVVNGGTIDSTYFAIRQFANNGTNNLTINGGDIGYVWMQSPNPNANVASTTVNGGTVDGICVTGKNAVYTLKALATSVGEVYGTAPVDQKFAEVDGYYVLVDCVYVAEVNGVKYESLQDAINAADGETVVLIADIELNASIKVEGNVTLDLAGYTITGTDNNTSSNFYLFDVTAGASFTVEDSVGEGAITLTATNERNWGSSSVVIANNRGTVTVNGGRIEHFGGTSMAYALDNLTNGVNTVATMVVNGGTINSSYIAIRQFCNGTNAQNVLNITGGTLTAGNTTVWMQNPNSNDNSGALNITGGTFNGRLLADSSAAIAPAVSGGTFSVAVPEEYCADGYVPCDNGDGTYGVTEVSGVEWYQVSMTYGSDLKMNFYLKTDSLVEGLKYYAKVTKTHANGCTDAAQTYYIPMTDDTWLTNGAYKQIVVDNIVAKEMNCTISMQIFVGEEPAEGEAESGVAVSNEVGTSVVNYALYLIREYKGADAVAVKTFAVDMLNYGAAAQEFLHHYDKEHLANADLTEDEKALATQTIDTSKAQVNVAGDPTYAEKVTAEFENTIYLNFYFNNLTAIEGYDKGLVTAFVEYVDHYGNTKTINYTNDMLVLSENGRQIKVSVQTLAPADANQVVNCVLYYDGEALTGISANLMSYCEWGLTSTDAAWATLCDTVVRYSQSAYTYFHANTISDNT